MLLRFKVNWRGQVGRAGHYKNNHIILLRFIALQLMEGVGLERGRRLEFGFHYYFSFFCLLALADWISSDLMVVVGMMNGGYFPIG